MKSQGRAPGHARAGVWPVTSYLPFPTKVQIEAMTTLPQDQQIQGTDKRVRVWVTPNGEQSS